MKDELRVEFSGKLSERNGKCVMLKAENVILKNTGQSIQQQSDYYEIYKRKVDLIFELIAERENKTDEESESEIKSLLNNLVEP